MNISKRLDRVEKIIGKGVKITDELVIEYLEWLKINPGRPTEVSLDWNFTEWLNSTPKHLVSVHQAMVLEMFSHLKGGHHKIRMI